MLSLQGKEPVDHHQNFELAYYSLVLPAIGYENQILVIDFYNLSIFLLVRTILFTFQVCSFIQRGTYARIFVHPYVCTLAQSGTRPYSTVL